MTAQQHDRKEIRQRAHRLAAEGIEAALNQWDLARYYTNQDDQDVLEAELLAIARRLRRQGADHGQT